MRHAHQHLPLLADMLASAAQLSQHSCWSYPVLCLCDTCICCSHQSHQQAVTKTWIANVMSCTANHSEPQQKCTLHCNTAPARAHLCQLRTSRQCDLRGLLPFLHRVQEGCRDANSIAHQTAHHCTSHMPVNKCNLLAPTPIAYQYCLPGA